MPYSSREQQNAYMREWVARRRAEFMEGKSCVVCGSTEDLEVDHVDPELKLSHKVWSWARERREAELAKCQVLCGLHHREKTTAQLRAEAEARNPCGTRAAYVRGCKCAKCRGAAAVYERGRRAQL